MKSFDLLVVGDANPDVVLGPLRGPLEFGQREQLVEHAGLVLGGSAAIMACGAARLGLRVAFAGRVGDDPAGAFVREALAGRGVDVGFLVTDPVRPTPLTAVVMAGDGDRAILTAQGCLTETGPEDVPRDLIAASRHVHAASFFLMPRLARSLAPVFGLARATGATTSLDTNDDPAGHWDHRLIDPVLEFTDFLLPNAAEASALSGEADPVAAAAVLVEPGADGRGQGQRERRPRRHRDAARARTGHGRRPRGHRRRGRQLRRRVRRRDPARPRPALRAHGGRGLRFALDPSTRRYSGTAHLGRGPRRGPRAPPCSSTSPRTHETRSRS